MLYCPFIFPLSFYSKFFIHRIFVIVSFFKKINLCRVKKKSISLLLVLKHQVKEINNNGFCQCLALQKLIMLCALIMMMEY